MVRQIPQFSTQFLTGMKLKIQQKCHENSVTLRSTILSVAGKIDDWRGW